MLLVDRDLDDHAVSNVTGETQLVSIGQVNIQVIIWLAKVIMGDRLQCVIVLDNVLRKLSRAERYLLNRIVSDSR